MYCVAQVEPSARLRAWVEDMPGLSARARRLLLDDDRKHHCGGRTEGKAGFRATAALAAMLSQPGRAFTTADVHTVLMLRPTAGGACVRGLRARNGDGYVESKLTETLNKPCVFCAASPPLANGADPGLQIAQARQAVEAHVWRGRAAARTHATFHSHAHGPSGARLLSYLSAVDGTSPVACAPGRTSPNDCDLASEGPSAGPPHEEADGLIYLPRQSPPGSRTRPNTDGTSPIRTMPVPRDDLRQSSEAA